MGSKDRMRSDDQTGSPNEPPAGTKGFHDDSKPHYLDHWESLRRRFREGGGESVPD
jgi:hypothetical protein